MVQSLCHEPFYTTGTWIDANAGRLRRLGCAARILCRWNAAHNENGDVTLVFSGRRIFPNRAVTPHFEARGHAVEHDGPSYLVHRYEEEPDFPKRSERPVSWPCVADRARGTAMLFNDRYGLQRLYYHEAKDAFYFAAEAKAILKVRPELRDNWIRAVSENSLFAVAS